MDDADSCFEATRRIKVFANGELDGKEMQLLQSWDMVQVMAAAAQRLGVAGAQIVYNSDGIEVDDASLIESGDILFISDGSPFLAPGRSKGGGGSNGARLLRKSSTIGRSARMRKDGTTPSLGIIGGYRVGRVLGEGGFGAVRLGVHAVTGEQVAMKFLNKGGSMSATEADRVATEVACLSELEHPNVIKLIRVINEPDFVVIVLDYAPGGDLKSFLRSPAGGGGRGLPEAVAKEKFLQVLRGVAAAHAAKIVHRDLKLENVLLAADGSCRITDFGLSAYARPGELAKSAGGSLFYLPPEIVKGSPSSGTAIDCWCLGVMLFALLTGRLPFRSAALDAAEARLRADHAAAYAQRVAAAAARPLEQQHHPQQQHARPVLGRGGSLESATPPLLSVGAASEHVHGPLTQLPPLDSGGSGGSARPPSAGGDSALPSAHSDRSVAAAGPLSSLLPLSFPPGTGVQAPPPIATGATTALHARSPLHAAAAVASAAATAGGGATPVAPASSPLFGGMILGPPQGSSHAMLKSSPTAAGSLLLQPSPSLLSVGGGGGASPMVGGALTPQAMSPAVGAAVPPTMQRFGSQPVLLIDPGAASHALLPGGPSSVRRQASHGIFPLGLPGGVGLGGGGSSGSSGRLAADAAAAAAAAASDSSGGPSPPRTAVQGAAEASAAAAAARPLTPRDYEAEAERLVSSTSEGLREVVREVHRAILACRVALPPDVPAAAVDLVHALLTPEPSRRATLTDALYHPWMTSSSASSMLAAVGGLGGRSARVGSLGDGGTGGGAFRGAAAAAGGVTRLRKQSSAEGSGGSDGGHGGASSGSTAQLLPPARPPTPSSSVAGGGASDHHAAASASSGLLPNLHLSLHRPGGVAGRAGSIDAGVGTEGGPVAMTPLAGAGGATGFAGPAAAARAGAAPSAHAVLGGKAAVGGAAAAATPRVNPGIISVGGVGATGAARLARRDSLTGAAASAGAVLAARAVATGGSSSGVTHGSGSVTPQPSPLHQGSSTAAAAAGSGHFARRASDVGTAPHSSAYLQLHSSGGGGGAGGKARPGDTPPVPVGPRLTPAHRSGSTASLPSTQGLVLPPPALASSSSSSTAPSAAAAAAGGSFLQPGGPPQSSSLLPALNPLHAGGASQQQLGSLGGLASPSHRPMLGLLAVSTRGIAIGQQGLGTGGGVAAATPSAAGRPSLLAFAHSSAGSSSGGSGSGGSGPPVIGQAVAAAAADRPRMPGGVAQQQQPLLLRSSSLLVGGSSSGVDLSSGAASDAFAVQPPGAAGGAPRQRPRLLSHTSAAAAAAATAAAASSVAPATAAVPVSIAGGSVGSDLAGLSLASPHRPASGVSSGAGGGGGGGRDDEGGSGAGSPARIPSPLGRRRLSSGLFYAAGSSWGAGGGSAPPLPSAVPPQRQEVSSTTNSGRLATVHTEADVTAGLLLDNDGEGDEVSGDAAALAALSAALPPSRFAFPPATARGGNGDNTTAASYATEAEAVVTGAEAAAIFDSVSPSSPTRETVGAALAATGVSAGGGASSPFAGLEATGTSGLGLSLSLAHPRGGPPSARGAASHSLPAHAALDLGLSLSLTAATVPGGVAAAATAAAGAATPSLAPGAP